MTLTPREPSFETTHWSLILTAGSQESPNARRALTTLCETYWYPLYAYVRRQGYRAEDAQDLTQGFFARFLEKHDVRAARRTRGRFRSFLLASMKHFLLKEMAHSRRLKRGGGHALQPLDVDDAEGRYLREPPDSDTPETIFDRDWARAVLRRVLARLRREWIDRGKSVEFDHLKVYLIGESREGGYRSVGRTLGLSEGAVKVTVHRLRRRYRYLLCEEIAATVLTENALKHEIQYLFRALSTR
jgi:RNA polymerase sigma factor (sigma-70 family)